MLVRVIDPRSALLLVLWMSAGAAQAQAPSVEATSSAASLVQQASGQLEAGHYEAALKLARSAEAKSAGVEKVLPLQVWIRSAEELGDLVSMADGLKQYTTLNDLGEGSARFIDASRLRYNFYLAEREGRVAEAKVAIGSVEDRSAGSPEWLTAARQRLDVADLLDQGRRADALARVELLKDAPGVGLWLDLTRAKINAADKAAECDFPGALDVLQGVSGTPGLTELEQKRIDIQLLKLKMMGKIFAGSVTGARGFLKELKEPGSALDASDQDWLDLYALRLDLDEAWNQGRRQDAVDSRDAYTSKLELDTLREERTKCMMQAPWLSADAVAQADRRRSERTTTRDDKPWQRSRWFFIGAGGAALGAGAMAGLNMWSTSQYQQAQADFTSATIDYPLVAQCDDSDPTGQSCEDFGAQYDSAERLSPLSQAAFLSSVGLGLASATMLTIGFTIQW